MRRLNRVGKALNKKVIIISGLRTPYEQWVVYQDFLRGGNLAATCCWRRYPHSWAQCGKTPTSNHCRSKAIDCGLYDKHGTYRSIGYYDKARELMKRHGLCLPVPGELWHVEVGSTWRS